MKIAFKKLNSAASITRAHDGDAGADLCTMQDIVIRPGEVVKVHTGIAVDIPRGYVGLLCSRSGQAKLQVTLANSVGVIDHGYQGEVIAMLSNRGMTDYQASAGERIAQLMVVPVYLPEFEEVFEFDYSPRGTGGFGSTGK